MIIGSADFLETKIAKLTIMDNVESALSIAYSLFVFFSAKTLIVLVQILNNSFRYFEETVWMK